MAVYQNMCRYYEENTRYSDRYYCKSPGNPEPGSSLFKSMPSFKNCCRRADENGCPEGCTFYVKQQIPVTDFQAGAKADSLAGVPGSGNGQRRRRRERLTYLSRLGEYAEPDSRPIIEQLKTDDRFSGKQGSALAENVLKAGAKAAIDIGKTMVDPVGTGVDFLADAAKSLIDEL